MCVMHWIGPTCLHSHRPKVKHSTISHCSWLTSCCACTRILHKWILHCPLAVNWGLFFSFTFKLYFIYLKACLTVLELTIKIMWSPPLDLSHYYQHWSHLETQAPAVSTCLWCHCSQSCRIGAKWEMRFSLISYFLHHCFSFCA